MMTRKIISRHISYLLVVLIGYSLCGCQKSELLFTGLNEYSIHFQVKVDTSNPYVKEDTPTMETDYGVIMLPKDYYYSIKPTKLVIYCHGGGGSVNERGSQIEDLIECKYLVSLGYAVMDMAGMPASFSDRLCIDHARCLGSYVAIRSYVEGYRYVLEHFNIDKHGVFLGGGSNGALSGCNIVNLTDIPVIAQTELSPLLSIEHCAWNIKTGGFKQHLFDQYQNRANTIRIYNMKPVNTLDELLTARYEKEKVGPHDAFDYIVKNEQHTYDVPLHILHPVNDAIVDIKFSRLFAENVNAKGGKAVLTELPDGGHTPNLYGQILGTFEYKDKEYPINTTIKAIAEWYAQHGGYPAVHYYQEP